MKTEKTQVATWVFTVRDKNSDPRPYYGGKAFHCTLFSDDTCAFYPHDDMMQLLEEDSMRGPLSMGELGRRKSESHREEFSVEVKGIDKAIIMRLHGYSLDGRRQIEADDHQQQWLNEMLEPYFWSQVNPYLARPLERRTQF